MEYTVARTFEKRETDKSDWHGRIGAASLVIASEGDIKVTLDGQELPKASVEYLLNFSLQSLQDAYAGADSLDEASGNWGKKRDALIAGTIGVRSGEGVSGFTVVARQLMRAMLKKAHGAKSETWKTFAALEDAEQNKRIDAKVEANLDKPTGGEGSPTFREVVQAEIARRAAENRAKKELLGGISMEL